MAGAAAGMAASAFGIGRASAADFTLRLANNVALDHPLNLGAQQAAERIFEETGGRVELRIFPSSQLGADTDVLSQVRSGAADFMMISGEVLSTLVPRARMYA